MTTRRVHIVAHCIVAACVAAQQPVRTAPQYTAADVAFMQGMISHHAQAITMAGWAPSHGASSNVQVLCARIMVSQRDEIHSMQRWLGDHHEMVPDSMGHMDMPGMAMGEAQPSPGQPTSRAAQSAASTRRGAAAMPGMLTPEQMAQLDHATGPDFDKLFLVFMIQHHEGALTMVKQLFDTEGAAQDEMVFKFASDVNADQTAEIDRMAKMLGAP